MRLEPVAEMQFAALEIAGRSMFSLEMGAFGPELRAMLADYACGYRNCVCSTFCCRPRSRLRATSRRWRFQRRWMALIERIIDARLASDEGGAPRDLFDLLRSARDPETGAAFTREQLRDQVATMIVAGHETTALALFWSLYLLANATGWQDAIAAETSGSRPWTRGRLRCAGFACSDPRSRQRGAAALSASLYDDARCDRTRSRRRS